MALSSASAPCCAHPRLDVAGGPFLPDPLQRLGAAGYLKGYSVSDETPKPQTLNFVAPAGDISSAMPQKYDIQCLKPRT